MPPQSRALILFLSIASPLLAAAPAGWFAREKADSGIYHDSWIDFNKNGKKDVYEDPSQPVDARVEDLLSQMTMEEKTAQMVTLYGFPRVAKDELPTDAWKSAMWKDGIGNIDEQSNGNRGPNGDYLDPEFDFPWSKHVQEVNEIQRWFIEETRLGVPADFTNEGIRGLLHTRATSFPAQLAVAAAFDRELVREIGQTTGSEAYALGYSNVYSPILDLARDPRWGRTTETYGEDPFLIGELGVQQILGIQENGVVSTMKHFSVYSAPKGARDGYARTDPHVTWRDVQEIYLTPFRRGVREGGALGAMASYNDYDGVPMEANSLFLTDILRHEFGFKGYVVSDSDAVEFIYSKHRVAGTYADAISQAVNAGLNIRTTFTPPEVYVDPLRDDVRDGKIAMATLDSRVRDILRVKFWQGWFDKPFRDPGVPAKVVRSPAHMDAAYRAARESIVLLKNDGSLLPLSKEKLHKVLVAGPLANDPHGWWSRYGPQELEFVTPLAGLRAALGDSVEIRYAKGVDMKDANYPESDVYKEPPTADVVAGINEAVAAADGVDVIVAVLGETEEISQESAGRTSLDLPGYQENLLQALAATGKPLVLVLSNGRPLSVNWAVKHVPSIVEMWFPGEQGGSAIADVLLGTVNPSGKLPITFPKTVGQIPFNFPAHPGSQARDPGMVDGPLFPFGYGLSYTTFAYANLKISPERQPAGADFTVTCDVSNTGSRAGTEIAQLYVRDDYSSVTAYDETLRGFTRVSLEPGETKTVTFTIKPEHLQLYNRDQKWVVEPGRFTAMIGASSEDIRLSGNFWVTAADGSVPEEDPFPPKIIRKRG